MIHHYQCEKSELEVSLEKKREESDEKGMASIGNRQWAFTAIGLTRQADEHGGGEIGAFLFLKFRVKRCALTKGLERQHDMLAIDEPRNVKTHCSFRTSAKCR